MNFLSRYCLLAISVVFFASPAFAQAASPLGALEELVTAKKVADVIRHYPVAVEQLVNELQENERVGAAKELLVSEKLRQAGYELRTSNDLREWTIVDKAGNVRASFTVVNTFISGVDAVILVKQADKHYEDQSVKFLSLRFEAGAWRVEGYGRWWRDFDFESEKFIGTLTRDAHGEAEAQSTLRRISNILAIYRYSNPTLGYPADLEVFFRLEQAQSESEQNAEQNREESGNEQVLPAGERRRCSHSCELGLAFTENRAIKDGYQFRYTLIDPGSWDRGEGRYQLTATPLQFGKTGSRSYFIDQTQV